MKNFSIHDEIRDYWTVRAETFDASPGHGMATDAERQAWLALIARHLGPGEGRKALDLASGTGVISLLMHDAGFAVTGMDFTEAMLGKARAKVAALDVPIQFIMRDVERTHEPDASYDALVTRHLVWTLVDPAASFAEWFRVLKPGGRLLIVDGDFVTKTWADRLQAWLVRVLGDAQNGGHAVLTPQQWAAHENILSQVHFKHGARARAVADMLLDAGFVDCVIDSDLAAIRRAQLHDAQWRRRLQRMVQPAPPSACASRAPTEGEAIE